MPDLAPSSSPPPSIALLQASSLSNLVQAELERMILAGELGPGDRLVEVALAARLGVSRGPLREAFRRLEESGLVRTEKNRGVFVRDLPVEEAVEIFDLRATMDEWVGRRLAAGIAPGAVKELRGLVEDMERAVRARDATTYHLLNLAFHDRLVELAGNGKLTAIYRRLVKELSLFRRLGLADDNGLPTSVAEHRQIVQAISAGDADAAVGGLFDHAMRSKEHMLVNRSHEAVVRARAR